MLTLLSTLNCWSPPKIYAHTFQAISLISLHGHEKLGIGEMESSMCLSSAILSLCLSCMWLGVVPSISGAQTDTIKPGEELQFSKKLLVSAKGTFTLGFFSLESGSYLGIWYTTDDYHKKVWVANRDKAISGTDANLTLDADGKLMITHSGGDPIVLNSNQAQSVLISGSPSSIKEKSSLGLRDCKALCWNDCSCTAYNSLYTNGTGCRFWSTKFALVLKDDANQEELYVLSSSRVTGKSLSVFLHS
ncbi:unnamed protein product, partial [Vitis vinifera]